MNALRADAISLEQYEAWFRAHFADLHHRSPYHHPAWIAAAPRGVGFDVGVIGVFSGDFMVAAVPGYLARRGPFRLFGSPLRGATTSWLGPVTLDPSLLTDGLGDLVELSQRVAHERWRASYARFTLRNEPAQLPELGPSWRSQRAPTYRLDLTDGREAVWAGLKSDCRRNIRRAEREGIEVVPLDDPELFYRMLTETFERHGAKSWQSARFFRAIVEGVPQPDPLRFLGARYRDEIVAAGLFLRDDREVHYVSGASSPKHGSLPTSYILHWHTIAVAGDDGLQVFSSDASGVPGIDRFKESFGPVLEKRCSLIWTPAHVRRAERLFMRSRKLAASVHSRTSRQKVGAKQ